MKYKKSLFVFRRDYRLDDNTGLIQACENSEEVVPCFLFEKSLINENNPVFAKMRIRFMIDSLKDLFEQAKNCNISSQTRFYFFTNLIICKTRQN